MNDSKEIAAIKSGDERAMSLAIDKYSRLLWQIAASVLRGTGTAQDVEECVADAFVYLWQHPEKFDARKGSLRAWLCMTARSRATDRYRLLSRSDTVPLEELSTSVDIMEKFNQRESSASLSAAVERLPEPDREIVLRRYYRGQKPKEIASALGMPVKQVDNRLYRAKLALRRLLAEEGDFNE